MTTTVKAALLNAAGTKLAAGTISAQVAVLTEGMVRAMMLSRLMTATAVLVVVSLIGLGGSVGVYRTLAAGQAEENKPAQARPEAPQAPEQSRKADTTREQWFGGRWIPVLAFVGLDEQGMFFVAEITISHEIRAAGLPIPHVRQMGTDLAHVRVYDSQGKAIDRRTVEQVLKKKATLSVVAYGEPQLDPVCLGHIQQLVKEGTLIFVLPPPGLPMPVRPAIPGPAPAGPLPAAAAPAGQRITQLEDLPEKKRAPSDTSNNNSHQLEIVSQEGRMRVRGVFGQDSFDASADRVRYNDSTKWLILESDEASGVRAHWQRANGQREEIRARKVYYSLNDDQIRVERALTR
ncbi:MAG: hypothetical protein L0Z62_20640 [Gemmataceae bacterium]|nr:hypothetical protein [Gemmataceae bacterium]